jgi:paraquat-inducible protein A
MGDPDAAATRPLVACQDCGLLYKAPNRGGRGRVRCRRCGAELYRLGGDGIHLALGLMLAALVLLVVANVFPLMTFRYEGREQGNVLISGVFELARQGLWPVAALVFLVTIAVPATKLLGSLWVLLPLYRGRVPVDGTRVFRLVETLHPWAMTEVYLLGLLVAYVKLADIADVALGPALFAFVALIVTMVAAEMTLEPRAIWERLQPSPAVTPPPDEARDRLGRCQRCGLLSRLAAGAAQQRCPRCHAALHRRKPDSISRTWALVLTGMVLYVPANLYPIMTVTSFGRGEPDTILSGVVRLFEAGMWPLALLVFFASITVPVLKLAGLSFLLLSVQRRWRWRPRQRTLLYRVIDAVGRWSMIDIFMISILVALVKLGSIATVEPGIGATAFAAVVVVTMIAATAFDPRLIWDAMEAPRERPR